MEAVSSFPKRKVFDEMKRFILASGSPRRKELLGHLQVPFQVIVSGIEEVVDPHAAPHEVVMSLALQKAKDIAKTSVESIVIGADTIVTLDGRMLGKPNNRLEASETLRMLSGRTHEVYTGVAIVEGERQATFYEKTAVTFWELTEEEIAAYLETGEPMDKAGSYGIQGLGSVLVKSIHGDYYSVVGLPVSRLKRELQHFIE